MPCLLRQLASGRPRTCVGVASDARRALKRRRTMVFGHQGVGLSRRLDPRRSVDGRTDCETARCDRGFGLRLATEKGLSHDV